MSDRTSGRHTGENLATPSGGDRDGAGAGKLRDLRFSVRKGANGKRSTAKVLSMIIYRNKVDVAFKAPFLRAEMQWRAVREWVFISSPVTVSPCYPVPFFSPQITQIGPDSTQIGLNVARMPHAILRPPALICASVRTEAATPQEQVFERTRRRKKHITIIFNVLFLQGIAFLNRKTVRP